MAFPFTARPSQLPTHYALYPAVTARGSFPSQPVSQSIRPPVLVTCGLETCTAAADGLVKCASAAGPLDLDDAAPDGLDPTASGTRSTIS
jgi:hypothetical protein